MYAKRSGLVDMENSNIFVVSTSIDCPEHMMKHMVDIDYDLPRHELDQEEMQVTMMALNEKCILESKRRNVQK